MVNLLTFLPAASHGSRRPSKGIDFFIPPPPVPCLPRPFCHTGQGARSSHFVRLILASLKPLDLVCLTFGEQAS
jgi:hypothetical protein